MQFAKKVTKKTRGKERARKSVRRRRTEAKGTEKFKRRGRAIWWRNRIINKGRERSINREKKDTGLPILSLRTMALVIMQRASSYQQFVLGWMARSHGYSPDSCGSQVITSRQRDMKFSLCRSWSQFCYGIVCEWSNSMSRRCLEGPCCRGARFGRVGMRSGWLSWVGDITWMCNRYDEVCFCRAR